jgi:hypothetical protein
MALLLFMFIIVFVPLVVIGGLIDGLETLILPKLKK